MTSAFFHSRCGDTMAGNRPDHLHEVGRRGRRRRFVPGHISVVGFLSVLMPGMVAVAAAEEGGIGYRDFAPHEARYSIHLVESDSWAALEDIRGQMDVTWSHDCEGWTVTQDISMTLFDSMGVVFDIDSIYSTWESFDGRELHFNLRRITDDLPSGDLRGVATRSNDGEQVEVTYRLPEVGQESLPGDTLFPVAHTWELLRKAQAGEQFYAARVFDGSETEWREHGGAFDVSAVIRPVREDRPREGLDDAAGLLDGPSWSVNLAMFPVAGEAVSEMEPLLETEMQLYQNGVSRGVLIDYGEFTVGAELEDVRPLPDIMCD